MVMINSNYSPKAHLGLRRLLRVCLMLGLMFVLATGLGACGRKGPLEKPEGSTYPKEYPTE